MIYCFIADGFEEVEALTPVDLLRRCGLEVKTVGIGSCIIKGSHGIRIMTDIDDGEMVIDDSIKMIILPGGMPGTLNLEHSKKVQEAIDFCAENGRYIAAICAAPSILGHKGLLDGKKATCFAGYEQQLGKAECTSSPVEADGKIITARSAGTALDFALKLVEVMVSKQKRDKIADSLMCEK